MSPAGSLTVEPGCPPRGVPELRPARLEDAEGIHALSAEALRDTLADWRRWRACWEWQHWDNPYRDGRPVGWVMVEDGRVIGHAGAVYVPLRVSGRRHTGAIVSAYCVAPDAAARGGLLLGLQLAQAFFDSARATNCVPLATSANEKTGAVFARFGCRPVAWTRAFYRVPAGLASEIRASWGGGSRVARRLQTGVLAGPFAGLTRRVYAGLRMRPGIPLPAGCCFEESADLAAWAEELGRLDEQYDGDEFGIERSADYLLWRYGRHPERERLRVMVVRRKRGGVLGAAIVFGDERPDRRVAVIEDMIVAPGGQDVVKALLCGALRFASDQRLDHLTTMTGRWSHRTVFWELGFETRARSAPAAVIPRAPMECRGNAGEGSSNDQGLQLWHGAMF